MNIKFLLSLIVCCVLALNSFAADKDRIIAEYDGKPLYKSEVENRLKFVLGGVLPDNKKDFDDLDTNTKQAVIQEIIQQKDQLLDGLAFHAKQREQALRALGLETNLAGWEKFLLRDPSRLNLIPGWRALTEEFKACQEANEINGKMINRSRQTLTHLLNVMRGQVAAPSLYTQKGGTAHQTSSYSFAKA